MRQPGRRSQPLPLLAGARAASEAGRGGASSPAHFLVASGQKKKPGAQPIPAKNLASGDANYSLSITKVRNITPVDH